MEEISLYSRENWGLLDDNVLKYIASIGGGAFIIIVLFCVLCCVMSMKRQQVNKELYQDYDFDIEMRELGHPRGGRAVAARSPSPNQHFQEDSQDFSVDSQDFSFETVDINESTQSPSYPGSLELMHTL